MKLSEYDLRIYIAKTLAVWVSWSGCDSFYETDPPPPHHLKFVFLIFQFSQHAGHKTCWKIFVMWPNAGITWGGRADQGTIQLATLTNVHLYKYAINNHSIELETCEFFFSITASVYIYPTLNIPILPFWITFSWIWILSCQSRFSLSLSPTEWQKKFFEGFSLLPLGYISITTFTFQTLPFVCTGLLSFEKSEQNILKTQCQF